MTTPTLPRPAPERLGRDRYEALVIGSGFGGAVAACRLAQAGVDVALVERGRRWPPGSYPRDRLKLGDGWLWQLNYGLYDADPLADILAVRAAGYGGGSLLYANVAMRPPHEVFEDWPAPYTRPLLDPWYDLAAHMLNVSPFPVDMGSPKSTLMAQAAEKVGRMDGFFYPNLAVTFVPPDPAHPPPGLPQQPCTLCGECDIGCNVAAKNTLDRNYLAVAEASGLEVATLTEVVSIARDGDGYRVRLREHDGRGSRFPDQTRDVSARYVFVCAGAVGSTELLLRCRDQYGTLPDLPAGLGEGYSGNGDFISFAVRLPQAADPDYGPTITTASLVRTGERHAGENGREHWFMLQDGGYSRPISHLIAWLDWPRAPLRALRLGWGLLRRALHFPAHAAPDLTANRTVALLAMGRDRADGRISLHGRRHKLRVRWDTKRNDPLYKAEQIASAEVVQALGGKQVFSPTWSALRQPVTVHNLGGCRMALSARHGVVNVDGEVFGHPQLYVLDGSVLPGATGANPALTITAVAERCMEAAVRRITGQTDWRAPEHAGIVRRPIPEDAAVASVRRHVGGNMGGSVTPLQGLMFSETLRGQLRGDVGVAGSSPILSATVRLHVKIPDLRAFQTDDQHRAQLSGTVDIVGLTAAPAIVQGGTLRLLALTGQGAERTMRYALPFTDAAGTNWQLVGVKTVVWPRNPWRATTQMQAELRRADASGSAAGELSISLPDALCLLTSLRPVPARREGGRTLVAFAAFFLSRVTAASLGRRGEP